MKSENFFSKIISLCLVCLMMFMLVENTLGQKETPPKPASPRPVTIPKPVEKNLPNGLRVIVVERKNVPLVTVQLIIKTGSEAEADDISGTADMTAQLLTKGTKTRTAPQIAEAIEALGGSIFSGANWDNSGVTVTVTSDKIAQAFEIMSDVVLNPTFKDEEIERLREQKLDELQVEMSDPATIARKVAARVVFGEDSYGHPLGGTIETVKNIKRADIVAMHDNFYRPTNAILVIVGDVKAQQAFAAAQKNFGTWVGKKMSPQKKGADVLITPSKQGRVVVIDMPDAGQAAVNAAQKTIMRQDPSFIAATVANSVLSGYSGRLNQEIRIKRGLSYGAGSNISARRTSGIFSARTQTKNESAAEVASLLISELKRLSNEPISTEELMPRKAVLIGDFGRGLETTGGLVSQIGNLALYGFSLDKINTYIQRVQAVTDKDIQQFARSGIPTDQTNIVIVGNAKMFLDELKKKFTNVEVISINDLDLNSASLRKKSGNALNFK
jgi:zinc protease